MLVVFTVGCSSGPSTHGGQTVTTSVVVVVPTSSPYASASRSASVLERQYQF